MTLVGNASKSDTTSTLIFLIEFPSNPVEQKSGFLGFSDFYHEGHDDLEGFFSIFASFASFVVKS